MTALAGAIGDLATELLERSCRRALDAQRLYATSEPVLRTAGNAVLGIRGHRTLASATARSADGRFLLVADIRLDNRAELLRSIGNLPTPRDSGDGELLAEAWRKWGAECLDRIVGDFALAVYDSCERSLTLARDASGQRPLFYGLCDGTFHFASMPSGVAAGKSLRPNFHYLGNILREADNRGPATAFEGIYKALPGELVRLTLPTITRRFYWQPDRRDSSLKSPELIEAYRANLDEAVRCRIVGQGSVIATQLSSGYDSAAVTSTAARCRQNGQRLVAFTSAPIVGLEGPIPRGRVGDESPFAAEVAEMHGIDHVIVRNTEQLLGLVRGHSRFFQEPVGNVFNLPWWRQIRNEASAAGAQVLLTGGMGNYTINAGGLPVLRDLVRRGEWLGWWRELRAVVRRPDVRWRGALLASFQPWLPEAAFNAADMLFNRAPATDAFCFLRARWRQDAQIQAGDSASAALGDYSAERLAIIRLEDPGAFGKGGLAQSGIQECDPMADRRLMEFSLRLPPEQMLSNGIYRPLARAALADRLPRSVIDARARGYQGADWFPRLRQSDANEMLEEISASTEAAELIDLEKLRGAIAHWPDSSEASFARIAAFGRAVTNALAIGIFLLEVERRPGSLGI